MFTRDYAVIECTGLLHTVACSKGYTKENLGVTAVLFVRNIVFCLLVNRRLLELRGNV